MTFKSSRFAEVMLSSEKEMKGTQMWDQEKKTLEIKKAELTRRETERGRRSSGGPLLSRKR